MRTLLLNLRNRSKVHFSKLGHLQFYKRKPRNPINYHVTDDNDRRQTGEVNMEIGRNPRPASGGKQLGAMALTLLHRFCMVIGRFIFQFIYGKKGQVMPPIKDLTLMESATSLATKIRTQKIKSVEVVQSFIDRINEINPTFNCVVDNCFEVALKEAAEADALVLSGKFSEEELATTKPFLGVPISTKDCIRVKGLLHSAGIWVRRKIRGEKDAEAIALMRAAGAIPFALTNVSECCMWWESVNLIHGRSKNPYDSNRIVGGSSGGEGALLAAAGSPFGLGSDIGGSIRMPAFFNGIFGHKASKYVVSIEGQYPIPQSEDQISFLSIGPMSRHATDLKPMLKIIAGPNATRLRLDEPVNVSALKIFYQEDCGGSPIVSPVHPDITAALEKVVRHFQETAKNKVQRVKFEKLKQSTAIWMAGMKAKDGKGFASELMNRDGEINVPLEVLKKLFGRSKCTTAGLLTAIVEKGETKFGSPKHLHLVEKRKQLFREFQDLLGTDGVFLYPTHPTAALYHNEPLIRPFNFSYTAIINTMGLPACSIPLGLGSEGLPIGIQVVANIDQDRLCLAVACELERVFGGWVAPTVNA